jgi:RNA polymerase sigma-70 factor (ECF subfamily)
VDDLALAHRLAMGDEAAFEELVLRETTSVFRVCHRILGSVEEAEDAVQETFVLAFRALDTYRGDGPPGAWVARIAVRECWRRHKSLVRRAARTMALDDVIMDTTADRADVAREVLSAEQRAEVRRAVEALPEPYRETLSLRFFGDLSPADIAAATGRPEATVRTHLHRGLQRLRIRMGGGAT